MPLVEDQRGSDIDDDGCERDQHDDSAAYRLGIEQPGDGLVHDGDGHDEKGYGVGERGEDRGAVVAVRV